jgi:hypothetical protein
MLMAAAFGLQCGGSALGRLVVVARSAHLVPPPVVPLAGGGGAVDSVIPWLARGMRTSSQRQIRSD